MGTRAISGVLSGFKEWRVSHTLTNRTVKIILAFLLILTIFDTVPYSAFAATSTLVSTDNTQGNSATPQIAAVDGSSIVYVTWQADGFIYLVKSTDGGASFGNATNISNSTQPSTNPQIALSGSDNVLVVWEEAGDIFLASSVDGGSNFSVAIVTNDTEPSTNPQIGVSESGEIYIVWEDEIEDDSEILLVKSTDGGASFGNATNISNSTQPSTNPQIALSGSDNVLVVWEEAGDIFVATSTDGGGDFDITNLTSTTSRQSTRPDIQALGINVLTVWQEFDPDSSQFAIAYKTSEDGGQTFDDNEITLVTADTAPIGPSIGSSTENFFVLWEQFDSSASEGSIFLAQGSGSNPALLCPSGVGETNDDIANPQLAGNGLGDLYSVWEQLATEGEGEKVIFTNEIDPTLPYITQKITGDYPVLWGLVEHSVSASGIVGNSDDGDFISVNWGDGETSIIPVDTLTSCSWESEPHLYGPGAVGTPEITSSLENDLSNETKATSESFHIDILPHTTELILNPVPSIQSGDNVTVNGVLKDLDLGGVIEGGEITFDGTGAALGLNETSVNTDEEGNFVAIATGPDEAATRLKIQAHFIGSLAYSASDSEISLFNAVGEDATLFNVTSTGTNVAVDLTGYNATIEFEEVIAGGRVFVEECESFDTERFLSLEDGICIVISPGLELQSGSSSIISLLYGDQGIADGSTANDIDMFLEDTDLSSSYLDISQSRNTSLATLSGQTTSYGKFILGLAIHESAPESALRKQVFVGEDIGIPLRDIDHTDNVNAYITLDKSSYSLTDTAIMTIEDKNADLDPTEIDFGSASVQSESDANGIIVPLTETGDDSGTFTGTFTFTSGGSSGTTLEASAGDELSVTYNQTNGARFNAVLHEVIEAGVVDVYDVAVDPESTPFSPLGYAVGLELVDTQLSSVDEEVTITLSYSNADIGGSDENYLRMFRAIELGGGDIGWIHIPISDIDPDTDLTLNIDKENKTVTANAELFDSGTIFVLGFEEDSTGGEGGGIGSTDPIEMIADSIASIRSSNSGGGGGGGTSSSGSGGAFPGLTGSTIATLSQSITSESGSTVNLDIPGSDQNLEIDFSEITSAGGTVTVTVSEISQLPMAVEGSNAQTVGGVYDIEPSSDLSFEGLVYVTLPYDEAMVLNSNSSEDDVRALHFDNSNGWEDKTVSIDTLSNTVTAALSSFSPVLVAIVEDGSFGSAYIEANPLSSISVSNPTALALQGRSQDLIVGQPVDIQTTIKNMERNSQSYTYIVQMLDNDGQVVHLDWTDTGLLARSQEKQVASSGWIPTEVGGYTVMIFMWEQNLQSNNGIPTPLAPKLVMQDIQVIEASEVTPPAHPQAR